MRYTLAEKETIIRCDDETKEWTIYTLQSRVVTKLKKIGLEPYRIDPDGGMYFKGLDFNQVSFRKKSKKRELTDEQRKSKKLISKMLEENGKSLVIEMAILKKT